MTAGAERRIRRLVDIGTPEALKLAREIEQDEKDFREAENEVLRLQHELECAEAAAAVIAAGVPNATYRQLGVLASCPAHYLAPAAILEMDARVERAQAEHAARRAERLSGRPALPPEAVEAPKCSRCQRRARRFDDLCGRCADELGVRPTGKIC